MDVVLLVDGVLTMISGRLGWAKGALRYVAVKNYWALVLR